MTPEKKFTIITVVYIVLVVLLGSGAIYWFQFEELAKLEADHKTLKANVEGMREKQRKLPELKQKEQELPQITARHERKIPTLPSGTWDPHRRHFYMLRKRCGVVLKSDREIPIPSPVGGAAGGPGKAEEAMFDLAIEGGFSQVGRLMHMLEHGDPIMVIDSFSIKGRRGAGGVALKDFRIRVKTFGFPPEIKK